jgi:hypothetical protein
MVLNSRYSPIIWVHEYTELTHEKIDEWSNIRLTAPIM